MSTILTGVRANSDLHLGNYLGAILPMAKMQQTLQSGDRLFMFVPDLHSFTTPIDHSQLYQNIINNTRIFLAAGVLGNQPNVFFYRQSFVSAHSELAWILSCFTYYGEMGRMIQFKDKGQKQGQNVSVGLFTYPILMAADILLYGANYIPVGDDQQQHLEIARDLAIRFNRTFEEKFPEGVFIVPLPLKEQLGYFEQEKAIRIRSLSNPAEKMSKSVTDPKGTILLIDEPNQAAKKVMSAVTDDKANIRWDWQEQPGITNLLQIYSLLSGKNIGETQVLWEGQTQYSEFKKAVAQLVEEFLIDFQTKLARVTEDQAIAVLEADEGKVNQIANKTLFKAQQAVGLRR